MKGNRTSEGVSVVGKDNLLNMAGGDAEVGARDGLEGICTYTKNNSRISKGQLPCLSSS